MHEVAFHNPNINRNIFQGTMPPERTIRPIREIQGPWANI
jgi:hypothetical protein